MMRSPRHTRSASVDATPMPRRALLLFLTASSCTQAVSSMPGPSHRLPNEAARPATTTSADEETILTAKAVSVVADHVIRTDRLGSALFVSFFAESAEPV